MTVSPLYAVIDLGSNSFHMLITRLLADSVQTVDKVKRKVRLASGLDKNNCLDQASIARGLECLSFFAERLQDIPASNIQVVATATLRLATNADEFLQQAEKILGRPVALLSGQQEAETIYLGVAHTSDSQGKRLVLDIGGASTELIVGEEFKANQVKSLDIGCVTYRKKYFADDKLNEANFDKAISQAKHAVSSYVEPYKQHGWETVLGGSGTMQALSEILMARHQPSIITYQFLLEIKQALIACGDVNAIEIEGLQTERKPVIASGLSILIALFESFAIKELMLSSGALREGLLYGMLPNMQAQMIRLRTIHSLAERFHIDQQHSLRIASQMDILFDLVSLSWKLERDNGYQLLMAACALHEIGLLLEYKRHQQHGAYILQNADLPGFDQADRQLIVALVKNYKSDIDLGLVEQQSAVPLEQAKQLLIILRLAVILCQRRQDDVLPPFSASIKEHKITIELPQAWLKAHPLIADELNQENQFITEIGYQLNLK